MKSYKIKIKLKDSEPLIYRRVIVPSNISFEKLHNIIQISMGWSNSYLYDFNIKEENLRVTCDKEAISEYNLYSKLKLNEKNDPHGFIRNMLKIKPKLSNEVNIEYYFNKNNEIEYIYDFGDYWKHEIILEEVIENDIYDYPRCIEAKGICPPEDVGGLDEYAEFLKIINDKTHPEYENLLLWANNQNYKEVFDIESANIMLKNINENTQS